MSAAGPLPPTAELVRGALLALTAAGIPGAPLHGLERWPEISRDVDLLVAPELTTRAVEVLRASVEAAGYECVCPANAFGPCLIAFKSRAWETGIELHLVPGVKWLWTTFATHPVLQPAHPFPTDPWASFAKRILLPLLAGGTRGREKVLAEPLPEGAELEHIRARAGIFCVAACLPELLAAIREQNAGRLKALAGVLRSSVRRAGPVTLPFRLARYAWRGAVTKFRALALKISPVIAVVGLDAARVGQLKEELRRGSLSVFTGWDFSESPGGRRRAAGVQKIPITFCQAPSDVPRDASVVLAMGIAPSAAFTGKRRALPGDAAVGEMADVLRALVVEAFLELHA